MAANPSDVISTVSFELNGKVVEAFNDETILQAAKRAGVEIAHLCFKEGMRADGNCRVCVVEIEGERVLQPSCIRKPTEGMKVNTTNERTLKSQKMVLELLASDVADTTYTIDSELSYWSNKLDVQNPRFESRQQPQSDLTHPAIAVNMDACIQCTRCLRACREEQVNDVIGMAFRGNHAEIVFDLGDDMGASSCVACGECVQACPTGALMPAQNVGMEKIDKKVDSVCPYCGVGCLLTFNVKDNKILHVEGRDGPANKSRLCVKGRYGFDYLAHPERLTKPLIRKEGVPKGLNEHFDPSDTSKMFREASWDEALEFAANGLNTIKAEHGPSGFSKNWCAQDLVPITLIIARACAMHPVWQPCSKG